MVQDMFRPPINRAMRVLDRAYFSKDFPISAARVHDVKDISRIRYDLVKSKDMLDARMITPVQPDPTDTSSQRKCVLLRPGIVYNDKGTWGDTVRRLENSGDVAVFPYNLHLDYDHWSAHDILAATLPEELENDLPTGFNSVGHIAHFNLRQKYMPYKHLIAQVTIDKNAAIETVINKTEELGEENQFRVLDYEILAGDPDLTVHVTEAQSTFRFDYSKVFWNSKLGTEHQRLIDKFQPGEAVCDVMAGVGPFAIPAGKKHTFVYANDLNPDCYKGLNDAIVFNKVDEFVRGFEEDGHSFIGSATKKLREANLVARIPLKISRTDAFAKGIRPSQNFKEIGAPKTFAHFVMNLPASALDFLPDFIGLYAGQEHLFEPSGSAKLPMVHCYCFGPRGEDDEPGPQVAWVCEQVSTKIGHTITATTPETEVWDVRDVAPKKRMFCASFRLPPEVAFRTT